MRILLDESVPSRLWLQLTGHEAKSVQRHGWGGIKNGKLLALAGAEFDVFLTADRGIEFQQNLAALPIAVVIVLANSNRLVDLQPLVPRILAALNVVVPCTLQKIAG